MITWTDWVYLRLGEAGSGIPNPRSHPAPSRSCLFSLGTLCNFCPPSAIPLCCVFFVSHKLSSSSQPTSQLFCPHLQLPACAAGAPADLSPQG